MRAEQKSWHILRTTWTTAAAIGAAILVLAGWIGNNVTGPQAAERSASDPAAPLVREARQLESTGVVEQRSALLQRALNESPDSTAAHWVAGEVLQNGHWLSLDQAQKQASTDPRLADYFKERDLRRDNLDDQLYLARWCAQRHLDEQARGHYTRALELQPSNAEAVAALELRPYRGALLPSKEIEKQQAHVAAAEAALKHWKPLLSKWRRDFESGPESARLAASAALRAITDPAAIPAIDFVWLKSGSKSALEAIAVLGALPYQQAVDALVRQALTSTNHEVHAAAIDQLKKRRLDSFVPMLVAGLTPPVTARVDVVTSADGVQFRRTLRREGEWNDTAKTIATRVPLQVANPRYAAYLDDALSATLQGAAASERAIKKTNSVAAAANEKVYAVLSQTTGREDIAPDPRAWWTWWQETNELAPPVDREASESIAYYDYNVPYVPPPNRYELVPYSMASNNECFVEGTQVWTIGGPRAIETVRTGDLVLAQDPDSGELAFKAVLRPTLLPPRPMINVTVGEETITSTRGHQYWVSGEGWRLARELKPGEYLHTPSGAVRIEKVEETEAHDCHNLVVADFSSYFVGAHRVLVHDNSLRRPTDAIVPGLIAQVAAPASK